MSLVFGILIFFFPQIFGFWRNLFFIFYFCLTNWSVAIQHLSPHVLYFYYHHICHPFSLDFSKLATDFGVFFSISLSPTFLHYQLCHLFCHLDFLFPLDIWHLRHLLFLSKFCLTNWSNKTYSWWMISGVVVLCYPLLFDVQKCPGNVNSLAYAKTISDVSKFFICLLSVCRPIFIV